MKQKVLKIKGLESHSKYNAFIDYSFNKCTAFMLVYINYNGKGYSKEKNGVCAIPDSVFESGKHHS